MKLGWVTFILILILLSCNKKEPLTLTFTGDVILDRGVVDELRLHGDTLLTNNMKRHLRGDFNFINLETTLSSTAHHQISSEFTLIGKPVMAKLLKAANVHFASVANNHSFDLGASGYDETLATLKDNGIHAIGNSCEPTILAHSNQRVAVLATSLVTNNEHLCIKHKDQLLKAVSTFEQNHPDVPLILYIHWGLEYQQVVEDWQVELAHELVDSGADAIIGHHPHVFQNVEYFKGKPIVYSLGNFVADAYLPGTTTGVVTDLIVDNNSISLSVKPVDLTSYFPQEITTLQKSNFMKHHLKYSKDICYYNFNNQCVIKDITQVNFGEKSAEWFFPVDYENLVIVEKMSTHAHKLTLLNNGHVQKSIVLHGELSEIEIGDINNDDEDEILFGISKAVHFDPARKKRLNIFKIEDGGFQTVWLGTQFIHDLVSYKVHKKDQINYLETIEKDSLNQLYKASYSWDEFGFGLNEIQAINENL